MNTKEIAQKRATHADGKRAGGGTAWHPTKGESKSNLGFNQMLKRFDPPSKSERYNPAHDCLEQLPWQHAVYTRRSQREEHYTFSHTDTCSVTKAFPSCLTVQCLRHSAARNARNLAALREAPVLILVTGNWATWVSVASAEETGWAKIEHYDHLQRLRFHEVQQCSELQPGYHILQYHCTMANYRQGGDHVWRLHGVTPFLSDIVILPQELDKSAISRLMASFQRATRKALKDSLILPEGRGKGKEMELVSQSQ